MTDTSTTGSLTVENIRNAMIRALEKECAYMSGFSRKGILLDGHRMTIQRCGYWYHFEIPENFLLPVGLEILCFFGKVNPLRFSGRVISSSSYQVIIEVPIPLGDHVAQLQCSWNSTQLLDFLKTAISEKDFTPIQEAVFLYKAFANQWTPQKEPIFPSTLSPTQQTALRAGMKEKISLISGGRRSGKTTLAAAMLSNCIREGKRVLYLTPTVTGLVDGMKELVAFNPVIAEEKSVAYDPALCLFEPLPMFLKILQGSAANATTIDESAAEMYEMLVKITASDEIYGRITEITEDIESRKIQLPEKRQRIQQLKARLEEVNKQGFLAKMRGGKESPEEISALIQEENNAINRLQDEISRLTSQAGRIELGAPVPIKHLNAYTQLRHSIPPLPTINDSGLSNFLEERKLIALSITSALLLRKQLDSKFDVVVVDDVQTIALPYLLFALSFAGDKCIMLGDEITQPPFSYSQSEQVRPWLQQSIFAYLSRQEHTQVPSVLTNHMLEALDEERPQYEHLLSGSDAGQREGSSMYFIGTSERRPTARQYAGKKKILPSNEYHAEKVLECIKHAILHRKRAQDDIIIIVPPSGQSMLLREILRMNGMERVQIASLGAIPRVSRKTVIFDTVVAGLDFSLRILDDTKIDRERIVRYLYSALTCSIGDFYIIADLEHFRKLYTNRYLTQLLELMQQHSDDSAPVQNAGRSFDDMPHAIRQRLLEATSEIRQSGQFTSEIDALISQEAKIAKEMGTQTIAFAERKARKDLLRHSMRVVAKRDGVNMLAQFIEADPVFRATPEAEKAEMALKIHECESENDFKDIVELWNQLLFESSSAHAPDHPRFGKGKLDSKVVWELNQICSLYRNDPETTSPEMKQRLAQVLQKILTEPNGKRPTSRLEWIQMYVALLSRIERYFDAIVQQLRGS